MYAFLRKPRWIAGHVLLVVTVVSFILLGLWQLRRNAEQNEFNALLDARMSAPAVTLSSLGPDPAGFEYRAVEVEGTYDTASEFLLQPRARDGVPGQHIVTPLVTDDGTAVLIDRGWVPLDIGEPPVAGAAPSAGTVIITGIALGPTDPGARGPRNPAEGELSVVYRLDIDRLQEQFPYPLFPGYVLLEDQSPPSLDALPLIADPPEPSRRPNLAYAVQWFSFTAVALVGYAALLRKTAGQEPAVVSAGRP